MPQVVIPAEHLKKIPRKLLHIGVMNSGTAFPRSFAKVQRMARVVIKQQFVSFIC